MKFIDEAVITVQSGDGGRGCVSFRREKYVPKGGPDGGDGGKGGNVIFEAVSQKRTLLHFRFKRHYKAQNGGHGQGAQKTGKNGQDLYLQVPPGTVISDQETGTIIKDLASPGESFVVAKGGRGGKGNTHFKTSTHQTPRFAQPGEPGEMYTLKLELKLLADVGIIGLPNAGKSTLISAISAARPKISDYPFTTLTPNLGVVTGKAGEPFVVADIPGLIEGAHKGAGLGTRFLKHVERTRVLVHLIDAWSIDPEAPLSVYRTVENELSSYSGDLAEKPRLIVINKMDLNGAQALADRFEAALDNRKVLRISAATRFNLDRLISDIQALLDRKDL